MVTCSATNLGRMGGYCYFVDLTSLATQPICRGWGAAFAEDFLGTGDEKGETLVSKCVRAVRSSSNEVQILPATPPVEDVPNEPPLSLIDRLELQGVNQATSVNELRGIGRLHTGDCAVPVLTADSNVFSTIYDRDSSIRG